MTAEERINVIHYHHSKLEATHLLLVQCQNNVSQMLRHKVLSTCKSIFDITCVVRLARKKMIGVAVIVRLIMSESFCSLCCCNHYQLTRLSILTIRKGVIALPTLFSYFKRVDEVLRRAVSEAEVLLTAVASPPSSSTSEKAEASFTSDALNVHNGEQQVSKNEIWSLTALFLASFYSRSRSTL